MTCPADSVEPLLVAHARPLSYHSSRFPPASPAPPQKGSQHVCLTRRAHRTRRPLPGRPRRPRPVAPATGGARASAGGRPDAGRRGESGAPAMLALRLKAEGPSTGSGRAVISEVETLVARQGNPLFAPENLTEPLPLFGEIVPPTEGCSRGELGAL